MRKSIGWIICLMALVFLLPRQSSAQADLVIDRMEVDIWSEYDRPQVLVIYHVFLPAEAAYPAEINLRIPVQAGDPFNVAVRGTDGNLYVVDYVRREEGEWGVITFTTPQPEIQFEYYDPGLLKNGSARSYVYRWPGDYAVNNLSIQVQQPSGAAAMQISPSLGAGLTGTDGMVYFNAQVGAVPANNPFEVSIQYEKSDDALSVESVRVEPSGPISEETTGRFDFRRYIPWLLAAAGVILAAGGVLWVTQSRRRLLEPAGRRRHTSRPAAAEPLDEDKYCHQCGRRAGQGDRFCRTCGSELRA